MLPCRVVCYLFTRHPSGMKKVFKPAKQKTARQLVALNLRLLRVKRDVTQEQLALEANVNKNYISQIETGTRAVSVDILDKLALAFGIPVAELLHDS
jgi:DNA-binding XRE family transcriptional regulator